MLTSFFIILGCVCNIAGPHMKARLAMMGGMALSFVCCCFYYALLGEWSGFVCSVVGVLGFLLQAFIPQLKEREYALGRAVVSISVIMVTVFFMFEKAADILPILGFSCARMFETSLKEQRVRMGYTLAGGFWVLYAFSIADPVIIICYSIAWVSTTSSFLRYFLSEKTFPEDNSFQAAA